MRATRRFPGGPRPAAALDAVRVNAWFGELRLEMQRELPKVETPVGSLCLWCDEEIEEGDNGVVVPYIGLDEQGPRAFHLACWQRQSMGGLNHIEGRCICCGGSEDPDPPHLTKREAAVAAVAAYATGCMEAESGSPSDSGAGESASGRCNTVRIGEGSRLAGKERSGEEAGWTRAAPRARSSSLK